MYLENSSHWTFFAGGAFSTQSRSVRGLHWPQPSFKDVTQDRTIMSLTGITGREDVSGLFCCYFILRWNSTMWRWCKESQQLSNYGVRSSCQRTTPTQCKEMERDVGTLPQLLDPAMPEATSYLHEPIYSFLCLNWLELCFCHLHLK